MALTLRLIRHGETDWAAQSRYTGRTDISLNRKGRQQAIALQPLSAESYDSVWCSDLRRCVETAELMGANARRTPSLREFDFGAIEGKRWAELTPQIQRSLLEFDTLCAPDGESMSDFTSRIDAFVNSLTDGRHLLITHGGVIRLLLRRFAQDVAVLPGSSHDITL